MKAWNALVLLILVSLAYFGMQDSTREARARFSRSDRELTKARPAGPLARNFIAEMAVNLIPDPERTPRLRLGLTPEDDRQNEENLSSPRNLELASRVLLNDPPKWAFQKAYERYKIMEVLATAVATPTNPSLDYAVNVVSDFILTDNLTPLTDPMELTLAMGDHGYLYQVLLFYHPDRAKEVYEKARGTRMNLVLDIAHRSYLEIVKNSGG